MRLRSITLKGFQSYRDEETVDLQGLTLAAVIGANHTGKSSLISNALDFALFGRSRGNSVGDVVSRGVPKVHVSVEFDLGDNTYKVLRSRTVKGSPEASLYVSDPSAEGGWRALSEKNSMHTDPQILDLLGMDAETAGLTWLIRQNEYGGLCNMDPAPRRNVLANAFGLSKYAELAKAAEQKRDVASRGAEKARYDATSLEARVEALKEDGPFPEIEDADVASVAKAEEEEAEAATVEMASLSDNTALREDLAKAQDALSQFLSAHEREQGLYNRSREHAQKVLFDATQAKTRAVEAIARAERTQHSAERALEAAKAQHRTASEASWEADEKEDDHQDAVEHVEATERALADIEQALSASAAEVSALRAKIDSLPSDADVAREIEVAQSTVLAAEDSLVRNREALSEATTAAEEVPGLEEASQNASDALDAAEKTLQEAREHQSTFGPKIGAAEASRDALKASDEELAEAVSALRDSLERGEGVCLSCRRPMSDDEAREQIAEQEEKSSGIRQQITDADDAIVALRREQSKVANEVSEHMQAVARARSDAAAAQTALHDKRSVAARRAEAEQDVSTSEAALTTAQERLSARREKADSDAQAREVALAKVEEITSGDAKAREAEQGARRDLAAARQAEAETRDALNANRALVSGLASAKEALTAAEADVRAAKADVETAKEGPARADEALAKATAEVEAVGMPPEIDEERQQVLVAARDKAQSAWESTSDAESARAAIQARRAEHRERARRLWQEDERRARVAHDLAELQGPLEKATAKAEELEAKVEAYSVLVEAFRPSGIPFMILSGIIEELNDEANDVMQTLGQDGLSVLVTAGNEGKKGRSVDKVLIHAMTADGMVDYATLSGSEQMRVALAIRLALTRCIARRSGNPLMTIVADECFAAFDPEGRKTLMNMFIRLSEPAGGGFSIFAIAHMADLTDAFPQIIEVTNTTGTSRAEVLAR